MSDLKGPMVEDHLSEVQIKKYSTKTLEAGELLEVDEHLTACAECQAKLPPDFIEIGDSLYQELSQMHEDDHLSYDQIVQYLEKADHATREQVETHLKGCPRCTSDLDDLKDYAREFEATPRKFPVYQAFALAAVIALISIAAALRYQQTRPQQNVTTQPVSVLVSINDTGSRITLDDKGKLSGLPDVPQNYQQIVIRAIQTGMVETPVSLQGLIGTGATQRGTSAPNSFSLLSPVGTFVDADRPLFQWKTLKGASKYRVTVLDEEMNVVAESGWIHSTSWKPDEPLKRSHTYVWQVAAIRNGSEVLSPEPPAREARFRILDLTSVEHLKTESARYQHSHLLLGLLYAQHGLLDDAQQHLHLVADANPESKEIKQLLENLQRLRS